MIKRKRVYICDHCECIALERTCYCDTGAYTDIPKGWTKLGNEDLCPTCSKIYARFKEEVKKEENNHE